MAHLDPLILCEPAMQQLLRHVFTGNVGKQALLGEQLICSQEHPIPFPLLWYYSNALYCLEVL